jgi:carboxypeptidase C (cathepsin A)
MADDLVESLPEAGTFRSPTYSGYLKVSDTKSLHYAFASSLDNPTKDPVVIWFNGGPGCSSMLAFMAEHGPFVIDDGESFVKENPYPWNLRANMLYIESPAGVGFSTAGKDDLKQNDVQQSEDAYAALIQFYERFPTFK